MNRSKIEWCDHTWNPITGCRHGCKYCYANTMSVRFSGDVRLNLMAKKDYRTEAARDGGEQVYVLDEPMLNETGKALIYPFGFAPTYHRYRMKTLDKLKMGNNIFVGAMADIFGEWVPDAWLDDVFKVCIDRPQHNYLFLTKNPNRFITYGVPTQKENIWYGTTITGPADMDRMTALIIDGKTFVSIEPLHKRLSKEDIQLICKLSDWVIIGAETGRSNDKILPEFDWIKDIVLEADNVGIPVFMKDSLIPIVEEKNMRREFPKQLQGSTVSPKMKKKLYDRCSDCKAQLKKSEMITLFARSKRGEQPKQFGFMCKECFKQFCKNLGLDIPELAEFADSVTIGPGDD